MASFSLTTVFLGVLLVGGPVCDPLRADDLLLEGIGRPDTEAQDLFRLGGRLFWEEKYPAAAKHYRDFVRRFSAHPRAPEAQMMLAESLYLQAAAEAQVAEGASKKAFREAEKEYQRALAAIPKGDLLAESAAFRLGEIEYNLKECGSAVGNFERVQADYPGGLLRGEARLLQSQCLLAQARAPEAVQVLQALLRDQPVYEPDPRFALAYGVGLFEVGKASESLAYLERLREPMAFLYAGRAHLAVGRPLMAVERFKQIPGLDPQGRLVEVARYLTAESFFLAKDYLSAIQAYEQFLMSYPQSALRMGSSYKIGLSQYERSEYLAARGSFQSVLQLAPDNEFAQLSLYMTAESFMKEGRLKEAGFAYADMAGSYSTPLAANALLKLGWCHFKQGDLPASEQALKQLWVRFPAHALAPVGGLLLGNVLTGLNRYGDAVRAYQESVDMMEGTQLSEEQKADLREALLALLNRANLLAKDYGSLVSGYQYLLKNFKPSLDPWRAATLLFIAEGYFRQGLYDKALDIYRDIVNSYPVAPESGFAVDGIAWCLFKKGDYTQAEAERLKLASYRVRPAVAPSRTVLPDPKVPEEVYIQSEYELAATAFNQKRYLQALDAYEAFERAYPQHPLAAEAALQAGWSYYRLEYYGQAIKIWERVEKTYAQSPVASQAAWATADTYFRAHQYEKAIASYQRILQVYPQEAGTGHARLRIAHSYYNAKDVVKAISAFESLLRESPSAPEAAQVLDFLTQLLDRAESKSHALDALTRVADFRSDSPLAAQARFRVARHQFESGGHALAVQSLEKLVANLSVGTELVDAQFYLAESYYTLKRYPEASLAFERVVNNYPGDKRFLGALFHLGACRFKVGEFAGAAEAFHRIAREHPATGQAPIALFNAGLAYRKLGKWEEAAVALKTYLEKYPEPAKSSNAVPELAAIYEEHRQFGLAAELLKEHRETLPKDDANRVEWTFRLAEAYLAQGSEDMAVSEYQALLRHPSKSNPFRLSALGKLGEHYEKKEDWRSALQVYQDLAQSATQRDWVDAAKARVAALREKIASQAPPPPPEGRGKGEGGGEGKGEGGKGTKGGASQEKPAPAPAGVPEKKEGTQRL